jgi:hypothetical protein
MIKSAFNSGISIFINMDINLKLRGGLTVTANTKAIIVQTKRNKWVFEDIEVESLDNFTVNRITIDGESKREEYLRVMRSINIDYISLIKRAVKQFYRKEGVVGLAATAGVSITQPDVPVRAKKVVRGWLKTRPQN